VLCCDVMMSDLDLSTIAQKHRTVKRLILSLNNIQILPYGFVHLNLQSLELRGNDSLRFPPENIAASGSKAILAFFTDLKKGSVKVRHAKIMLVGHGRAGKSTLAKALHMQPADVGGLLQELKDKAGMVVTILFVYLIRLRMLVFKVLMMFCVCRYEELEY